jgi:cobyrinic acid a,c-diamide synthase
LVSALAEAARKFLDLPALLRLAQAAPPLPSSPEPVSIPRKGNASAAGQPLRIGIAQDAAFSFYYQDNLDLLEEWGATLVPFSPLADARLPTNLHGLYLGGGFPEVFAPTLARNASMRSAVASALKAGLPCYAECGGLVYLTQSIAVRPPSKDRTPETADPDRDPPGGPPPDVFPLVGFFPCRAVMTPRLQHFGYATVSLLHDTPLGPAGTAFRVHEFHYSRLEGETGKKAPLPSRSAGRRRPDTMPDTLLFPVYTARKPGGATRTGGLARGNTLALYPHLHFHSCPETARFFLRTCAKIAGLSPEIAPETPP